MNEFEFIEKLKNRNFPPRNPNAALSVGIGDDCAVLSKDSRTDLVITTDLLVEDIDFRPSWSKPEFIGHKALAVSLSDVAAMGATPVWSMISIGIPQAVWQTNFVEEFYHGWFSLAAKYQVELIGGDISKTPDKIVIDSIVAGEVKKKRAVLRSTAEPNDLIYTTGTLGGAAIGLQLLENGERLENSKQKHLLMRQLKPNPQIEIGQILGKAKLATSMIDISDGLSGDLTHICRQSQVGAKIFSKEIPVETVSPQSGKDLPTRSSENGFVDHLNFALHGGEDFELLFTINPKKKIELENALANYKFSRIGEVTANAAKIELISKNKSIILRPKGFRHF